MRLIGILPMQGKRTVIERFFDINQQLIYSFFEIQPMLYGRYLTLHARLKKNAERSFEEFASANSSWFEKFPIG